MGTAQYLSPEQAQGQPVDARSDLYSIGIVLYELLTGRVPFDAESPVTVALKQVSEPPRAAARAQPRASRRRSRPSCCGRWRRTRPGASRRRRVHRGARGARCAIRARCSPPPAPPVEEILEEEDRRSRRWWLWLLILLALAAIAFGLYLTLRPEQLTVPNVIGRESATASQILQNRGFEVDIVPVVNADVERDHVAAQDPRPDTEAPEGSTVTITVSTGPGEAAVPARGGMPATRPSSSCRTPASSPRSSARSPTTCRKGRVVETSPPAGTTIERGSTVTLQRLARAASRSRCRT